MGLKPITITLTSPVTQVHQLITAATIGQMHRLSPREVLPPQLAMVADGVVRLLDHVRSILVRTESHPLVQAMVVEAMLHAEQVTANGATANTSQDLQTLAQNVNCSVFQTIPPNSTLA